MKDFTTNTAILNNINQQFVTGESNPALLERTPLAGAYHHYRSLTLTTHTGINPLTAAAASLLTLNNKLKRAVGNENMSTLHQKIVHEINAFETNAKNRSYRSETIIIARYLLCATLDETIVQTRWGQLNNWNEHKLLTKFQRNQSVNDNFFLILDRLSEDPALHIDLLELIYLCLRLGFHGKYRQDKNDNRERDKLIDSLYQQIRIQRQEPKALLKATPATTAGTRVTMKKQSLKSLLWKTSLASIIVIILFYFGFATIFDLVTQPIQQQIQKISSSKSNSSSKNVLGLDGTIKTKVIV